MNWPQIIFVVLFWGSIGPLQAQVPQVYIDAIELEGLKQTQASLVYNELDIQVGDSMTLEALMPALERNKRYLINTLLFRSVKINVAAWEGELVRLRITVQENWYIFPLPIIELADRNFNVWWTRHERSLRRTNIGMWLVWRNLSGYNDLLVTTVQFGYNRKFELDYILPPMGRTRKFGFNINALYLDTKEIAYQTVDNKLLFYNNYSSSERQYQRIRGQIAGVYRPTLLQLHRLQLTFLHLRINSEALALNPYFFREGQQLQRSFGISYSYSLDRRDIQAYPLNGYFLGGSIGKEGFGIFKEVNFWELWGHVEYYKQLDERLSLGIRAKGQWRLGEQPSYNNNRALGFYENYVRGYEYYVIDGQAFVLLQGDINFKLLDVQIPLFKKMRSGYLNNLPLRVHLRYLLDYGHVWDAYYSSNNPLNNTDLIGTGFGLDFVFYAYNIIVQFEYTFNKSGEKGLYLRYKFNF
jgi:outer membrane protein assembly factor BamA